jgi:hypothetical protein
MAFNGAIQITSLITPGSFIVQDVSTGSDPNLIGRTLALYQADGTLLNGGTVNFPLSAGASITINISVDLDLLIVATWQSSSPLSPPSTYSASGNYLFRGYSLQFLDQQIGAIQSNPNVLQDTNFQDSLNLLHNEINNAIQAASTGQQASSQRALSSIQNLILKQNFYF